MAQKKKVKTTTKAEKVTPKKNALVNQYVKTISKKGFNRYLILIVFLVLLGVALYYAKGLFIAAMVSGKPITRLELVKQLEKEGGKQALENLITKKIISEEARKEGVSISNEDVQAEIDKITKSIESQGSTLDAALSMQGQTRQSLEENIRIQKTVEKLLANDITINDDDILKYYNDNKTMFPKESKYEDLKGDIRDQLKQEKLSSAFKTWMDKVRSESQIVYFVNF